MRVIVIASLSDKTLGYSVYKRAVQCCAQQPHQQVTSSCSTTTICLLPLLASRSFESRAQSYSFRNLSRRLPRSYARHLPWPSVGLGSSRRDAQRLYDTISSTMMGTCHSSNGMSVSNTNERLTFPCVHCHNVVPMPD